MNYEIIHKDDEIIFRRRRTKVVNVKVAFIRPKFKDLEEWMTDTNNIYIGRKGVLILNGGRFPEKDSIWANPFKIKGDLTREEVLEKYEDYITEKLNEDEELQKQLISLKGKNLGCWCKPEPCHGDILKRLIKKYNK
jgi:hypothetical protein